MHNLHIYKLVVHISHKNGSIPDINRLVEIDRLSQIVN